MSILKEIFNSNIPERPEIEEDEDSCVVRIAPKPIKLKIKPLTKPEEKTDKASDFAIVTTEDVQECSNNHVRERSISPVTNMHPKKKLAHMTQDSLLVNNFPVVNNLIHSTLPFLSPIPVTNNHQTNVNNKLSSLPPSLPANHNNKKVIEHNLEFLLGSTST